MTAPIFIRLGNRSRKYPNLDKRSVGSINNVREITYNTDLILNYANLTIDSASYGFPANSSANQSSSLEDSLSYETGTFGSIFTLTDINTGNAYTNGVNIFVRSTLFSNSLPGTLSYDTTSNTVIGTSTIFDSIFANDDVIALVADSANTETLELQVIKEVTNSTQIILYGPPTINSTGSAIYEAAPTVLPANLLVLTS